MTGTLTAVFLGFVVSLGSLLDPFLESGSKEAREGRDRYREKAFVEAVEHFSRAQKLEGPEVNLNVGAAAYRAQNYDLAAAAFAAAATAAELAPGRAQYDLGNARYQAGDIEGAVEAYRDALRRDPTNDDARFNYELVLRELQSGEQQPEEQDPSDGEDESQSSDSEGSEAPPDSSRQSSPQEEQNQQDSTEDGSEPSESESQESEEGQQGEGGDNQEPASGEDTAQSDGEPTTMLSPEEAARLLNAVTPEERELIQARLESARRKKVEKDW